MPVLPSRRGGQGAGVPMQIRIWIVLEGTTCSDVPDVKEHEYSTVMGQGAVLTIMDRTSYPNKKLVEFIYNTAIKNNIPAQYKKTTTGGNDAGRIQLTHGGVVVASLSVPCRYIHSPVSVMSKKDFESCLMLVKKVLNELSGDENIMSSFKD